MATQHLIIFVKNPIPGTVKTRVARTVGHQKATDVYRHLLQHTQDVTRSGPWQKTVYYGDFINPADGWNGYARALQTGADLGQRMANAFGECFTAGAKQVVIIGSDCLSIGPAHIQAAFEALSQTDVVIGPATDGGYYLLGMSRLHTYLFENMPWSEPQLGAQTRQAIQAHGQTLTLLEELTDIDEWVDYERAMGAV